jgi:hypothetical protein
MGSRKDKQSEWAETREVAILEPSLGALGRVTSPASVNAGEVSVRPGVTGVPITGEVLSVPEKKGRWSGENLMSHARRVP